jgi:FkbM family methyltransferase
VIKQIATVARVWRESGPIGVVSAARSRSAAITDGVRRWYTADRWWLGRVVELRGNRVRLERSTFDLSDPAIPTLLKARFLLNRYERVDRAIVGRFVDSRLPVLELGGGLGVIACLTNPRLDDPTAHVVLEANPELLPTLEKNRTLNQCRFAIVHGAIGYGTAVSFNLCDEVSVSEDHASYGFLSSGTTTPTHRSVWVPTISVHELLDHHAFARCTLVCDIEGAELHMGEAELTALARFVAILILEVHTRRYGQQGTSELARLLEKGGFRFVHQDRKMWVLDRRSRDR